MSRGQAFVEFLLSLGPFLIVVVSLILGGFFIGFLGFGYYLLQKTALEISTDARVIEAVRLKSINHSDSSQLLQQALSEIKASNESILLGFFGRFFVNDIKHCLGSGCNTTEWPDVKIGVLLPPNLGVTSKIRIGSDQKEYRDFNSSNLCSGGNNIPALSCPVVTVAQFNFLGFQYTLTGFGEIDLSLLRRGRFLNTPNVWDQFYTPTSTGNSSGSSTPPPTPPEDCPIQGLNISGNSSFLNCRDILQHHPTYAPTLLATIVEACGNDQVRFCGDGTCMCVGGTG